jgi:hypothetical protein
MKALNLIIALVIVSGSLFSQTGDIVSVSTEKSASGVIINWSPSVQPETNYFEIQKSADGNSWKVIAIMFPFEDASTSHVYRYNYKTGNEGNVYYRIRQLDMNKNEIFSKVKMLSNTVADR